MYESENQQLSINYNLEDNTKYKWTSSYDSVVTVNKSGRATANSEGEAEVTVDETGKKKGLVAITAELDGKKYELYVRVAEKK